MRSLMATLILVCTVSSQASAAAFIIDPEKACADAQFVPPKAAKRCLELFRRQNDAMNEAQRGKDMFSVYRIGRGPVLNISEYEAIGDQILREFPKLRAFCNPGYTGAGC